METKRQDRLQGRILLIAILLLTTLIFLNIIGNPLAINRDASLFLDVTDRILDGDSLYADILDNNMPMAHVLHIVPLLVARVLNINPILPFNLFILFTSLLSTAFCWLYLSQWYGPERYSAQSIFLMLTPLLATLLAVVVDEFGQREHFFVLLFLPAALARMLRWEGMALKTRPVIVVALLAAIGANLKPHLLLIPILLELFAFLYYRRWRPLVSIESLVFIGFTLAYAVHFLFWSPAMKAAFFDYMAPLTLEFYDLYSPFSFTFLDFVRVYAPSLLLALVAFLWTLVVRTNAHLAIVIRLFAIWSVGGFLALALQRINYPYHRIPLFFASEILFVLMMSAFAGKFVSKKRFLEFVLLILPIGCIVGLGLVRATLVSLQGAAPHLQELYDYISNQTASDSRILLIDTQIMPAYPTVLQSGRGYTGRYVSGFPIAYGLSQFPSRDGVYANGTPITGPLVEEYVATLMNDIENERPELILFREDPCYACPAELSLYTYLHDLGFVEAVTELGYVLDASVDPFVIYQRTSP